MASSPSDELEKFRQQWQREVQARSKASATTSIQESSSKTRGAGAGHAAARRRSLSSKFPPPKVQRDDEDAVSSGHDAEVTEPAAGPSIGSPVQRTFDPPCEPETALEHYERAVQREKDGNFGDSVTHYRKAFRLDADVDHVYKKKHFPRSQPLKAPERRASLTNSVAPKPDSESGQGKERKLPIAQLILSFASSVIAVAETIEEESAPPSGHIASLPSEILLKTLNYAALIDPANFSKLSQTCKRLAYLVDTEDRIWKRLCIGKEYGFAAMWYRWSVTITWNPLPISMDSLPVGIDDLEEQLARTTILDDDRELSLSSYYPTYRDMFRRRPRVRFNGCYISTVNYIRPGAAATSRATFSSPVLIVTYYRYLRFFRDGSCISLLTTSEPIDVVYHLTKENVHSSHASGLPASVMNNALRGRWKLGGDPYNANNAVEEESTLHIETEGADADRPQPKYNYKMMLQMKAANRSPSAAQNTKLNWLGYWSYNKLTDDWAEFSLKNDRAFFWSRVKSYGDGE